MSANYIVQHSTLFCGCFLPDQSELSGFRQKNDWAPPDFVAALLDQEGACKRELVSYILYDALSFSFFFYIKVYFPR
jgi:hypothetical protein